MCLCLLNPHRHPQHGGLKVLYFTKAHGKHRQIKDIPSNSQHKD